VGYHQAQYDGEVHVRVSLISTSRSTCTAATSSAGFSTRESAALARELVEQTAPCEAVPSGQLTLHANRGASMRTETLAELLVDLGIEASFSRPRQSNDNPYSESLFKTTKYAAAFPACFAGIDHARDVITPFFEHYYHHHRHAGIGLMTPAAVHHGHAPRITAQRAVTLTAAFERHPHRFKGRLNRPGFRGGYLV
jgi:putative transposase